EVTSHPKSSEAWGKLGQAFHCAEFFSDARTCYTQAAALDPGSPRWLHLLGLLQLPDEPDAALTNLARAADLAGVQTDAPRLRLAQALAERGRFDEAGLHLQRLLASEPTHPGALLEAARARVARNDLEKAAELLSPCLTNAYTARRACLLLAQVRQRQGRVDEGAVLARRATSMPRG